MVTKNNAARQLSDILQCGSHPQMSLRSCCRVSFEYGKVFRCGHTISHCSGLRKCVFMVGSITTTRILTGIHARTAIHKRTSFRGLEELFTVANVAIDYLVNHSFEDISDVTVAFLALENIYYMPYLRHFGETLLGHGGRLKFYDCNYFA